MSWQHEFKESLKTKEDLELFFEINLPDVSYPVFIPRTFASRILEAGENSPLWKQFIPDIREDNLNIGRLDPIGDKVHAKGNQLIHRYKNRVLFTPTTICPVLCRYCFRKNELSSKDEIFDPKFKEALSYLRENPEVNEIILTGGDPLILSNEKLALYIQEFSDIGIKFFRIHSRTPIILPSRIDEGFLAIMESAKHLFTRSMLMIHVNHVSEVSTDVEEAINLLIEAGIEVYSQSVLLKGVNDTTEDLYNLFMKLADLKVKPYYLHHSDEAKGAMHFYVDLEQGRRIFAPLHNLMPGWAIPQYILDIPGGEGKVPAFNPESFEFSGKIINKNSEVISIN